MTPGPVRAVIGGALKVFGGAFLALPTGLITAAFLSRQLGPSGYGLFSVAASIVVLLEVIISQVYTRATGNLLPGTEDWLQTNAALAWRLFLVAGGVALGLMLTAPLIEATLGTPQLAMLLVLYALEIPIYALGQQQGVALIARGRAGQRAVIIAARWLSRLLLMFAFVGALSGDLVGAVLANISSAAIELLAARWFLQRLAAPQPLPLFLSRALNVSTGAFFLPLTLYFIGLEIFKRLDLWMVEVYRPSAEAGYYAAAQNLTFAIALVSFAISPVIQAQLSRLQRAGDRAGSQQLVGAVVRLPWVLLPFAAFGASTSGEIVAWIYDPTYAPTAVLLAPLIVAALALVMINIQSNILIADHKATWVLVLHAPLAPLALLANLLLVPALGALGAALSTLVLAWVVVLSVYTILLRRWQLRVPLRALVGCGLLSILVYGVSPLWSTTGWLLLVKLAVGCVVIGVVLLVGFVPNIDTIRRLIRAGISAGMKTNSNPMLGSK
ncbi:MAG: lipopolysaccharide biosynthesis protein [Chloroflexi bacterium]|nr:lipopolysaccharide biosynthesis protein [Chloroflexota bacterium]